MRYSSEQMMGFSEGLQKEETRENTRSQLADLLALTVGFEPYAWAYGVGEEIEKVLAKVPEERRTAFLNELKRISEEVGWKVVSEILNGQLRVDQMVEEIRLPPDVKLYHCAVRRPENLHTLKDFINAEGASANHWVPRRFDIQRYVRAALVAHERSGRSGPIRVLDVGGGSGFMGKLLVDEAVRQGQEIEVVVIDPDKQTVAEARSVFADTPQLSFDEGTATDAVLNYGPTLPEQEKERFVHLEDQRLQLVETGRDELKRVKATLNALEGESNLRELLSGPFGKMAGFILADAGIGEKDWGNMEKVRTTLAKHYEERFSDLNVQIAKIRAEQERLMRATDARTAKFDVVLNSWMPEGIDFTREIRWLAAPVIIYAKESNATGVTHQSYLPNNLGKEVSYQAGETYLSDPLLWWNGMATACARSLGEERDYYRGLARNISEIQTRRDVGSVGMRKAVFADLSIAEEDQYPWEKSLEAYVGKQRVADGSF